jgi:hypothetical protein
MGQPLKGLAAGGQKFQAKHVWCICYRRIDIILQHHFWKVKEESDKLSNIHAAASHLCPARFPYSLLMTFLHGLNFCKDEQ